MEILNPRYKQGENETKFEHGLRLIEVKCEENPSDLDWQDIIDILQLNIHRDSLRKACNTTEFSAYNVLKYFKDKQVDNITDDNIIKEIEIKKKELDLARKKLQTVNIEYNKMLREQAREDLLIEKIRDIIPSLDTPEFQPLQFNEGMKEYLLCFGDIHFDKFFESVNNSYSIDEVYRRFNLLLSKIIKMIQKENISKLNIVNCGDTFEGLLRISALKSMRVGLLESVVQFSRFMAEWLNTLSEHVEIIYYHIPTANHSELRLFNQKRGETDENLERIVVNYIHDLLRDNPRIEVPITTDSNYVYFQLLGYNFIALHGDSIKNIKGSLKDLSVLHRRFYDYVLMGHYHSGMEYTVAEGYDNNMEILVIPSMVGSDTYSDSLFVGSKSSAKMYVFEQNQGHTETYNFILN